MNSFRQAVLARQNATLDGAWLEVDRDQSRVADVIVQLLSEPSTRWRGAMAIETLQLADPRFVSWLSTEVVGVLNQPMGMGAALGHQGLSAVDKLIELLQSDQKRVRESAAEGLGIIGPDATVAIGPLTAALEDD